MKKILFMSLLAGSFALTACNPAEEKVDNAKVYSSAEDILNGISFTQYADEAYTQPAADGNYIFYQTNPGRSIQVYTFRSDGSMNLMASGASGKFSLKPGRGSDPNQTVYIRSLNYDGTLTETSTTLNVFVQQELDPEIRFIASDAYGSKVWKWNTNAPDGVVWGNMGYCGGAGADVALSGNGKWWGVTSEAEFEDQTQHASDGLIGDHSMDATMVIADDGTIKCFDANGTQIRKGTYTIKDWNPNDPTAWKVGTLETSAGAILWPYEINSGGNKPTKFDICYLTSDRMVLVYPDGGDFGGLGNWGEATFWQFASNSDILGMAAGYEKTQGKDWTWDQGVTGAVWGNMGYCGGAGSDVGTTGNGQWWGCTSEADFADQLQHSNDGTLHGDESMDAYFTLTTDGMITRHDGKGNVINSGIYSFDLVDGNTWKVADLNTTAGTILWPFEINSGGNMPTKFEVVYLTGDKMTLVYPDGGDFGGLGNWGEATFWHFKAK